MLEHTSRRILVVFSFSIRKPSVLCSWSSHYEADEYYSHMLVHSWFKYINKSSVASYYSLLRSCDIINSSVAATCMVWTNPEARRHTITSQMNLSESAKIKPRISQQTTVRERLKKSALMNSTMIDGRANANISFLLSMNIMGSISESMVPLIWASSNNYLLYFHRLHGSFKRSRWMEISANVN